MNKKFILIKADTNDADYVYQKTEITDEELESIKSIIEAIKNFKPYNGKELDYQPGRFWRQTNNFPSGDGQFIPREDLGEKSADELYGHLPNWNFFIDLCPFGEYGIHTINGIEVITVLEKLL